VPSTNDGNDLVPFVLWLVQQSVDGPLYEGDRHAFLKLMRRVDVN